jgi:hypothetical protein
MNKKEIYNKLSRHFGKSVALDNNDTNNSISLETKVFLDNDVIEINKYKPYCNLTIKSSKTITKITFKF